MTNAGPGGADSSDRRMNRGPNTKSPTKGRGRAKFEESRPDFRKISVPAPSFVVVGAFPNCSFVGIENLEVRARARAFNQVFDRCRRRNIERFRREVRRGRVVELRHTDHYFFMYREDEVVRVMRAFLADGGAAAKAVR